MDIDRFLADHDATWQRLRELTKRARNVKALSAEELEELVDLYQRTSTHLSIARSAFNDPALTGRLTRLVADANAVIYGTRPRTVRAVARFFTVAFPGAVWHDRWFVAVAAALTFVPALAVGVWLANSQAAVEASAPEAVREAYVEEDFEAYYSVRARRPVRVGGLRQQRAGRDLRLRGRHPAVRRDGLHPDPERIERRRRRRAVRGGGRVSEVLGSDPPPRPARSSAPS